MTVLIVDDQINVVSGLVLGIHWDKIGITKVLKAYNAYEAKEQLKKTEADIVLCDIEMPVENGLSLCTYCREQGYSSKFIFLTAHADFMYAKEAIQLGGFDYVLQPASYEEIEKVILRAKDQVLLSKKVAQMEKSRHLFIKQRDSLIEGLCREWCFDKGTDWERMRSKLKDLGIVLFEDKTSWLCLIHFFEKSHMLQDWEDSLIAYAISNILQELFYPYGYHCLCWIAKEGDYAVYIYAGEDGIIPEESLNNQLEKFRKCFISYYSQDLSCYIKVCDSPQKLPEEYEFLVNMRRNNVGAQAEIFWSDQQTRYKLENIQLTKIGEQWESLLKNKLYDSFASNAKEQLYHLCRNENINAEILNRFYQEFMRIIYLHINALNVSVNDLFQNAQDLENACSAYTSVKKMEWLIEYVHAYFNETEVSPEHAKTQIDSIFQYIRMHLDQDIRRTDIAEAVHLNPNYISRLFKSIVGISLKEYILQEKMKLAAHFVRETNLPISVIAMKVGYTNFSLFTQTYKKMNGGFTPMEERKQYETEEI